MVQKVSIGTAVLVSGLIVGPALGYAQQSQDIGKEEYAVSCAGCHGTGGKGDGPLAAQLKTPPADLTTIQKKNTGVFPFDRVYDVVDGREAVAAHGPREMPVWGNWYTTQAAGVSFGFGTPQELESFARGRIIALIGYVYTLQAK